MTDQLQEARRVAGETWEAIKSQIETRAPRTAHNEYAIRKITTALIEFTSWALMRDLRSARPIPLREFPSNAEPEGASLAPPGYMGHRAVGSLVCIRCAAAIEDSDAARSIHDHWHRRVDFCPAIRSDHP